MWGRKRIQGRAPFRPGIFGAKGDVTPKRASAQWIEIVGLLVSLLGMPVLILGLLLQQNQIMLMKADLEEARLGQRAWVQITGVQADGFVVDDGFARLDFLSVDVANVGSIPARKAWFQVSLVTSEYRADPSAALDWRFTGPCSNRYDSVGIVVFPGERSTNFIGTLRTRVGGTSGGPSIYFVRICIFYQSGTSDEIRTTQAFYVVGDGRRRDSAVIFERNGLSVPRDALTLHRHLGGGAD